MKVEKQLTRGPNYYLVLLLLPISISLFLSTFLPSYGLGSSYYEISGAGRPTAAYGFCCCKKEIKNPDQVLYSCQPVEGGACPQDYEHYDVPISQCPSSLIFTKHKK